MPLADLLPVDKLHSLLDERPDWILSADRKWIEKEFHFANFQGAMAFMGKVALDAETLNHHPNWSNVYKTVHVALTTHDVEGLTKLDFELAAKMDQAFNHFSTN